MDFENSLLPPNQAYGAGNYGALGIVLQQALVISTLTFAAIFGLWTQIHHLLLLAGRPACSLTARTHVGMHATALQLCFAIFNCV